MPVLAMSRQHRGWRQPSVAPLCLIGELLIGKLGETIVVVGNAPHDRPGFLVSHLIGNSASFLCTKAPMLRIPETNFLQGITSISGRDVQAIFRRRRPSRVPLCDEPPQPPAAWLLRSFLREVGDVQVSRLWIEQAVQDEVERFATLPAARPAVASVGAEFLLPYER